MADGGSEPLSSFQVNNSRLSGKFNNLSSETSYASANQGIYVYCMYFYWVDHPKFGGGCGIFALFGLD